jgi:hypothetical protein
MDANAAVSFSYRGDETDTTICCTNGAENYHGEKSHLLLISSSFFLNTSVFILLLFTVKPSL